MSILDLGDVQIVYDTHGIEIARTNGIVFYSSVDHFTAARDMERWRSIAPIGVDYE